MAIQVIRVAVKPHMIDPRGNELLYEIKTALGIDSISRVRAVRVYRYEGISPVEAEMLAVKVLAEEVHQEYTINRPLIVDAVRLLEIAYKPGVMNPEVDSLLKTARAMGIQPLAADSSWEYAFYGENIKDEEIELIIKRLLVNETVERVVTEPPVTLLISGQTGKIEIIPLRHMSDEELMELSRDKLFLNLEEMRTIQAYFRSLGRDPTDGELETLAQTWSEHCVHKTFKSELVINGYRKPPLFRRLQEVTRAVNHPMVLSAFVDNSGVIDFYEGWALCGKVETHNSPSAIEPYGGAMTGSGGVFRDIMGTGQGAKVIASTNMFCLAPPDLTPAEVPPGCLHPHYILRRVVAGVRDYGNRMGIPTNNGSLHFHKDFRAKPSVIVGAYGIIPRAAASKGRPQPGDLAVVVGGRTGRDGIHGATFSSGEMTARTIEVNASAVQIGHAIEEKRVLDAILEARERGLIRAITDCGAGGFASALGEMGAEVGVEVWLERAPLKYSGLKPWEIWLSESQERMIIAVAPDKVEELLELCSSFNVEATVIARFTGDCRLLVTYNGEKLCDLDMEFLHHGLPRQIRSGYWHPLAEKKVEPPLPEDLVSLYLRVMAHLNVCSKEPIVRMYDHGVQGTCALPPFAGEDGDSPNDAVVLTPLLDRPYGVVIAHGLNPVLNRIDPYYGSMWALVEAVSNAVAVGADPGQLALIDNFIWPFPDEEALGALDRAVDACVDFARVTGMPFVSGKDSLSSTYRAPDGSILKIPPVLCISVFGRLPDVMRTVSADLKQEGSQLLLIGHRQVAAMAGSVYYEILGLEATNLPQPDPAECLVTWRAVHRAITAGAVRACHDISHGGLAAAIAEMAFGGRMGVEIEVPEGERFDYFLFNETPGCFIVELAPETKAEDFFNNVPYRHIGRTLGPHQPVVRIKAADRVWEASLAQLKEHWQKPMQEVFGCSRA